MSVFFVVPGLMCSFVDRVALISVGRALSAAFVSMQPATHCSGLASHYSWIHVVAANSF